MGEVSAMLTDPDTVLKGLDAVQDSIEQSERERERESLERLIAKLGRQDDHLVKLLLEEAISRAEFDQNREEVAQRAENARALLADLDRAAADAFDAQDAAAAIHEWAEMYGERLDSLSEQERVEILRLAASSVTLNADHEVAITLAFSKSASCPST